MTDNIRLPDIYSEAEYVGEGASSIVFSATSGGEKVALKFLKHDVTELRAKQSLLRELLCLSRIDSPYVAKVLQYDADYDPPYFAMEYVDGSTLADMPASELDGRSGEILRDIARGVEHIHSAGIVHGDIKPENIVVNAKGIKIIDFGLSGTGPIKGASGTFSTMAPEAIAGRRAGILSDIYSLGVVALYTLTGNNPFLASTIDETIERHRKREPQIPRIGLLADDGLRNVIQSMLSKDPFSRPSTPFFLRMAIESAMGHSFSARLESSLLPPGRIDVDKQVNAVLSSMVDGAGKRFWALSPTDSERYLRFRQELANLAQERGGRYIRVEDPVASLWGPLTTGGSRGIPGQSGDLHDSPPADQECMVPLIADIAEQYSRHIPLILDLTSCTDARFAARMKDLRERGNLVILGDHGHELDLPPFDHTETGKYVASCFNPAADLTALTDFVFAEGRGNIERTRSILAGLLLSGNIYTEKNGWHFNLPKEWDTDALLSDFHGTTACELLEMAAIADADIPVQVFMTDYPANELFSAIDMLERAGLVSTYEEQRTLYLHTHIPVEKKAQMGIRLADLLDRWVERPAQWLTRTILLRLYYDDYDSIIEKVRQDVKELRAARSFAMLDLVYRRIADHSEKPSGRIANLKKAGLMCRYNGLYDRAVEYYEEAIAIAHDMADYPVVSAILNDIGVIRLEQGQPSIQYFEEALAISRASEDKKGMLTATANLAGARQTAFEFNRAMDAYRQALALSEELSYAIFQPVLTFNMAELAESERSLHDAIELYNSALELGRKNEIDVVITRSLLGLCRINLRLGKVSNARKFIDEAKQAEDVRLRYCTAIEQLRMDIYVGRTPEDLSFLTRMYGRVNSADRWELYRLEALAPSAGITLDTMTDTSDIPDKWSEYRSINDLSEKNPLQIDSLIEKGDVWGAAVLAIALAEESPKILDRVRRATEEPLILGLLQMEEGRLAAIAEDFPRARKTLERARFHFGVLSNEVLLDEVEQISHSMIHRGNDLTSRDTLAILDVINSISASLEIDEVLSKILDEVLRISGAERGIIFLMEGGNLYPHLVREHGRKRSAKRVRYSTSVVDAVLRASEPLFKESVLDDRDLSQKDSVMDLAIRMVFCVPFSVDGEVIGLLYTDSKLGSEAFSISRRNILEILAKSAAIAIRNAREHTILQKEKDSLKQSFQSNFEGMIGDSPQMRELYHRMYIVAEEELPVLVTGETGVGKDLVSRIIHNNGPRRDGPFIPINCAAVPENLLESELFGYEPGAFTGATKRKMGKFELANGGTLFLNEIGEMPTKLQAKLLTVIETGILHRLGSNRDISIDTRIIAATNRNLRNAIEEGMFREDLFYRLAVLKLDIPSLRERRGDIPALVEHFLSRIAERSRRRIGGINRKAMDLLMRFSWPGNVRQLINVLEQAALFAREELITPGDLPNEVQMGSRGMETGIPVTYDGLKDAKEELERRVLIELLENHSWHVADAARAFDMDRTRLHQLIKKHGIHRGKG